MEDTAYRNRLIKMPKIIYIPYPDLVAANNSNFLIFRCDLYDPAGEIIPGIQFHYSFKPSAKKRNEKYTLHWLDGHLDRRLFQIEVYEPYYPSHKELNGDQWFGPHVYYNGRARRTTSKLDSREAHHDGWMRRFFRHTNIVTRERTGSFQRSLL